MVYAEHPWIREGGVASDKPIENAVLQDEAIQGDEQAKETCTKGKSKDLCT